MSMKGKGKNIMDLVRALKDHSDEWEKITKIIYEDRKKAKLRETDFDGIWEERKTGKP